MTIKLNMTSPTPVARRMKEHTLSLVFLTSSFKGDFFLTSRCDPPERHRKTMSPDAKKLSDEVRASRKSLPARKIREENQDFSVETRTHKKNPHILWNWDL